MRIDINKKYRTVNGEDVTIERVFSGKVYGIIHASKEFFTIWWHDGELISSEFEALNEEKNLNLVEIKEEFEGNTSKPVSWEVFNDYQEMQNMELARLNNELVDLRTSREELGKETRKRVAALVELNKETKKELRKELIDLKSYQIASSVFIIISLVMSAVAIVINLSK
jgi:hypothetical protein